MKTRQRAEDGGPASISIAAAVNSGSRCGTDCAYSVPAVQASVAPSRARMDGQWPGSMPPSGRATSTTPSRPISVPVQTRTVQRWPLARKPSNRVSHSGVLATISAAMLLEMRFSDHITSPLPTARSRTPASA